MNASEDSGNEPQSTKITQTRKKMQREFQAQQEEAMIKANQKRRFRRRFYPYITLLGGGIIAAVVRFSANIPEGSTLSMTLILLAAVWVARIQRRLGATRNALEDLRAAQKNQAENEPLFPTSE